MSWFNLSTEHKNFVAWLNWTDARDIVAIEIRLTPFVSCCHSAPATNVTAPADEPPATKVSDLVIVGTDM